MASSIKYLLLIALLTFIVCCIAKGENNETRNIIGAGVISIGSYYVCRDVLHIKDKFGCAVLSMAISELIMVINVHTMDTDSILTAKMRDHTIGAMFVIPVAILE